MIIECINCSKIFEVNAELIPSSGRTIQCGSCNHVWFYKYDASLKSTFSEDRNIIKSGKSKTKPETKPKLEEKILSHKIDKIINKKDTALIKYEGNSKFTILNIFGYIIVGIISFVALIIILDTFQLQLNTFFPNLEFFLFSLYETIKDVFLFSKDLIK